MCFIPILRESPLYVSWVGLTPSLVSPPISTLRLWVPITVHAGGEEVTALPLTLELVLTTQASQVATGGW